ncbi:MFS transporter [Pseudoalteromonas sp. S16_S37]|uniref:MFS transporter n=1 Tax=Pseudoalteromonas sp. S16_S37 TaxID=2720228 RepID=UPI0016813A79|nr:MFS transporter [Pseudoalteromonas sp. S16_S37]MBD1584476.1 MFS transporter [Pseudoalteromonas sp. S16_S37]
MNQQNSNRLFVACCLALTVTAMTFAIRAGILTQLSANFELSDAQLGWVNAMAFLGFPVATVFGGLAYNWLGPKKLLIIALIGHVLGLILTISATGFGLLIISSFCIGFANGAVEAGCNPLVAKIFHTNKTTMLNRFHVWFPGGIVIGALISFAMTQLALPWQSQIAVMLLPTILYGYLVLTQAFPVKSVEEISTFGNARNLLNPLFIFMAFCMSLTSVTELGTQQWIERVLGASGVSPMIVMAMITGVMAVGRFFAGPFVHSFNPLGVLFISAIFAALGLFLMSAAVGIEVYFSALLFAFGVTYFWPTMLGFVAEKLPNTGALGMSVMGGVGMFSVSLWSPVIGRWIDLARTEAQQYSLTAEHVELITGQATLEYLVLFPSTLIIAFAFLLVQQKNKNQNSYA